MENKIIQIVSYGWEKMSTAEHFGKDAMRCAKISLIRPTTNTPGLVYKNKIESTHISVFPNGIKYDVIININVSDCLNWMDKSIQEELTRSLYYKPVMCKFIN
jgi:hypothetical protein